MKAHLLLLQLANPATDQDLLGLFSMISSLH
ncbi:unnamed protein product [Acanthoscelides obtectus]|uniref:Uncharacterized protein n=1 Tax=Acanthoscelides obtectus TaxID=200917 RepID=A0A9P0K7U0_ACAOB|nr:unnamed protein product [Acanthoscelides obtectus]CAK1628464.1 hypothetical protein AOBTE_LOCUS5231 [Acanthoscelides obtectus]